MRSVSRSLDRVEVTFDDSTLVANAGLIVPPATLMVQLGLETLINSTVLLVGRVGGVAGPWLTAQPPVTNLPHLQDRLERFVDEYTTGDPTAPSTGPPPPPPTNCSPKTSPTGGAGTHHRVRHDRIDKTGAISLRRAGRMHHISIGRAHAGTPVVPLINDLEIRVLNTTTGELLRHLTLDPTRGCQPRQR